MSAREAALRAATVASVLLVVAAGGYAGATPHRPGMTARQHALPTLRSGSGGATTNLYAVAAVPGTSYAYVIQARGLGAANNKFSVMRLKHGHLKKVWAPKLGGRYGSLGTLTAVSKKNVYVGGATEVHGPDLKPAIFRLKGKKFVPMKLPGTDTGAAYVGSITASSPSNVWAVGGIYPTIGGGPQALRYDGKKWAFTTTPQGANFDEQIDVSTSAPNNVWATRYDGNLLFWNGSTWTDLGPAPVTNPGPIATSSRHLVYVAGTDAAGKRAIMKFNGQKWSKSKIKGVPSTASIVDLTLVGKQGWATAQWQSAPYHTRAAILHTSGGAWTPQYKSGKGSNQISAISAGSAHHVFAVGSRHAATSGAAIHPVTLTLHGHKWKASK